MIALLVLTRRRNVMGTYADSRLTMAAASTAAVAVLMLHLLLTLQIAGVPIPGLTVTG
jgi:manganese transport protein